MNAWLRLAAAALLTAGILAVATAQQVTVVGGGSGVTSIAGNAGAFALGQGLTNSTNVVLAADGVQVQALSAENPAATTGTTTMAGVADSVPQITDGTEILTRAITPKATTNNLIITLSGTLTTGSGVARNLWIGLFQDATAAAIAAWVVGVAATDNITPFSFSFSMAAGTVSSTTFRARVGNFNGLSDTWAINGISSARRLGGASRWVLTVRETKA